MSKSMTVTGDSGRRGGRVAAQKASQLAAVQLESSSSEDEGEKLSFGEPSRQKPVVRATYAKKARVPSNRSSSPKQSPQTTRIGSTLRKPVTYPKAKPKPITPATRVPLSEPGIEIVDEPPTSLKKRQNVKAKAAAQPRPSSHRKRRLSDSVQIGQLRDNGSLSPLTSSEPESPVHDKQSTSRVLKPWNKLGKFADVDTLASSIPESNSKLSGSSGTRFSVPIDLSFDEDEADEVRLLEYTTVELKKLVPFVWVRINASGELSTSPRDMWWPAKVVGVPKAPLTTLLYGSGPPACKASKPIKLTVPSPSLRNILSLERPGGGPRFNLKTYSGSQYISTNVQQSPQKKQKIHHIIDSDASWQEAYVLLEADYEEENDGLPMSVSTFKGYKPTRRSSVQPSHPIGQSISESEVDSVSPPPRQEGPNAMYQIPGETVLARDSRRNEYWPAKLMRFIPATVAGQKPRYEVLFFSGEVKRIHKDWFYDTCEEGFRTCKLGITKDNYGLDEERDKDDNNSGLKDDVLEGEVALRAPSPTPCLPAPTAFEYELSIREQFAYVKPVMEALMNGQYAPAQVRHVAFMKGGRLREEVSVTAGLRHKGTLRAQEVQELTGHIRQWLHRRGKRQELGLIPEDIILQDERLEYDDFKKRDKYEDVEDDVEMPYTAPSSPQQLVERTSSAEPHPPPSSLPNTEISDVSDLADGDVTERISPPQSQSQSPTRMLPTYSQLSARDQLDYVISVLQLEAAYQITLWREGLRECAELLSPEEESRLRERAIAKGFEGSWVRNLIFEKRSLEGGLAPKGAKEVLVSAREQRLQARRG